MLVGLLLAGTIGAALAQNGGQWVSDPKTGCKVWSNGSWGLGAGLSVRWGGPCSGGIANGRGTLEYFQGGKRLVHGEADLVGGKENGRVLFFSEEGARIEAEFRDGKANGRYVFVSADGNNKFDGQYRDDVRNGPGSQIMVDLDARYDGEWVDGKFVRGIYTRKNGERYEGEFLNYEAHGRGTYTFVDGSRYEGELRDGKPDGRGTYRGKTDDGRWATWTGEWQAGCYDRGPGNRVTVMTTSGACGF